MNRTDRTTIRLTSSRSYARLAMVIKHINENLYGEDMFKNDRIDFEPKYDSTGDLTHFEVTGSPLDFFQIGLRYGADEEKEYLQPYLMEIYREALQK